MSASDSCVRCRMFKSRIVARMAFSAEELTAAQQIVDLFAANPGAGTIGFEGRMLDRPHLARARALLELARGR